jgi:hypothetical protein
LAFFNNLFILDSEGLLLQTKSDKDVKNNELRYFSTCEKSEESSKGTENPLELLPGDLLEEPLHHSLQKIKLQ